MGVGLNTMSLGGLAIAVGIMVDASIIMVENIYHRFHKSRGEPRSTPEAKERVAHKAAIEVGRPIAFATLIIIAVFLPALPDGRDRGTALPSARGHRGRGDAGGARALADAHAGPGEHGSCIPRRATNPRAR